MKKTVLLFLALAMSIGAGAEALSQKYQARLTTPRLYDCFRTYDKIKIDGKLNEGAWLKACQ